MSTTLRHLVLLASIFPLMGSCTAPRPMTVPPLPPPEVTKRAEAVDLSNKSTVNVKLLSQYVEWQGTPYKMGGQSKNGIDCSGFAQLTFRSKLGYDIPRTTKSQLALGRNVKKDSLRAGDLLFFKTGFFSRHVGIYLSNSKFLHASTSKGVMVSSLDDYYWRKKYWKARRLDIAHSSMEEKK